MFSEQFFRAGICQGVRRGSCSDCRLDGAGAAACTHISFLQYLLLVAAHAAT